MPKCGFTATNHGRTSFSALATGCAQGEVDLVCVFRSRLEFAAYNAERFHAALEAGHVYPEAWVHLATWWRVTNRCPEWPPAPEAYLCETPSTEGREGEARRSDELTTTESTR